MANIQEDINQIATARYGREVRGSIVNALILMNDESSEAIDKAVTAQDSAVASATEAKSYADRLVDFGGGTTGQVLTKKSNADFDYSWEESQGGTSDAYETTYGASNVGDTLDIMPRLAGAVQGTSPTPKDADTLGGKYRAEDIDLIKENSDKLGNVDILATLTTIGETKTFDLSQYKYVGACLRFDTYGIACGNIMLPVKLVELGAVPRLMGCDYDSESYRCIFNIGITMTSCKLNSYSIKGWLFSDVLVYGVK